MSEQFIQSSNGTQLASPGLHLEAGWKYLFTGWFVSIIGVIGLGVVAGLNKHTTMLPFAEIPFMGVILLSIFLLGAALIMAIKSMKNKQGGLALLVTTLIVSIVGLLAFVPVLLILSLLISGDTR